MARTVARMLLIVGLIAASVAIADDITVIGAAFEPFAPPVTTEVALRDIGRFQEPRWTTYAFTEALFWGRDNQAGGRPLLATVGGGTPLFAASDLQFPVSEGVRAFYGRRDPDAGGWEIGYFGLYGQSATRTVLAPPGDFLQVPEPLGGILTAEADAAIFKYQSIVNSAEANVFTTATDWRDRCGGWLTVDWLAGFRYIDVEESSSLTLDSCAGDTACTGKVPYGVRTRNNMFGAQIGTRGRMTWRNWALEGWLKAGLLGNAQKEMQSPLVTFSGAPIDRIESSSHGQVGYVGDINLSAIYRLTDTWGIRAGYNTVWLGGLALAPNQYDFSVTDTAGGNIDPNGGMFLHGANLGLEARW